MLNKKIGVVITTYKNNGVYIRQAMQCFFKYLPKNTYYALYINESEDPNLYEFISSVDNIDIHIINDQQKNGGLTATWNHGIHKCFVNNCEIIALSNDDILFDQSIVHIFEEAEKCKNNEMKYYGPLSNNPGVSVSNKKNQYGLIYSDKEPYKCMRLGELYNINGFFMVFPKHVLIINKFDKENFFDPRFPFGGNEVEWFKRFIEKEGIPIIVPRTFILHYKLHLWQKNNKKKQDKCIYTINTGSYEKDSINLKKYKNIDSLYFSDNISLMYKCLDLGINFFLVTINNNNPKLKQREIKSLPHKYLPSIYNKSLYIDGNCSLIDNNFESMFCDLNRYDIICFRHPRNRNILSELKEINRHKLENTNNINTIKDLIESHTFYKDEELTETNILYRNHNKIKPFSEFWFNKIKICARDQASYDLALHVFNINYKKYTHNKKLEVIIKCPHLNPVNRKINDS